MVFNGAELKRGAVDEVTTTVDIKFMAVFHSVYRCVKLFILYFYLLVVWKKITDTASVIYWGIE